MKKIGEGFTAVVYTDGEYAYKKYHDSNLDNMRFETRIQNEIYENTDLDVAKYKIVGNQIKMTLFSGKNLADRIINEEYMEGFQDFINLQIQTFQYEKINLADSFTTFEYQIMNTIADETLKINALKSLSMIERVYKLCHFDFHPENIVYHNDVPRIIDWTNAKLGNPIMDIASTYIIFLLFAPIYADLYVNTMIDNGFQLEEIKTAMPVMAFIRFRETADESLKEKLIDIINGE